MQVAQVGSSSSSSEQQIQPRALDAPSPAASDYQSGAGQQSQNLLAGVGAGAGASGAGVPLHGSGGYGAGVGAGAGQQSHQRSEVNVDKWNWQSYRFEATRRRVSVAVAVAGVGYGFRVRANNSIGFSNYSDYSFYPVPTRTTHSIILKYLKLFFSFNSTVLVMDANSPVSHYRHFADHFVASNQSFLEWRSFTYYPKHFLLRVNHTSLFLIFRYFPSVAYDPITGHI